VHQGEWLKREIQRKKQTISGFAARIKVSRSQLHEWMTQPELRMRPDLMWEVIDELGYGALAEAKGYVREPRDRQDDLANATFVASVIRAIQHAQIRGEPVEYPREPALPDPALDPPTATPPPFDTSTFQPLVEIPLFDLSLAAGPWADVLDVPGFCGDAAISQGLFRVRLSGDSMSPLYKSGMIVEFECLRDGRHQLSIDRDYYVQKEDGSATFKRLAKIEDDTLTIRAINKKRFPEPMIVERRDIVRMAVARGEFRPFD
jgi:hypothetical protein